MAIRPKIIKQDNIQLASSWNTTQIWQNLKEYTPDIFMHPAHLFTLILRYTNQFLSFILFVILIGQTVHILDGSERRYINLRHLLIKWIFLLITFMLAEHIKSHTSHDQLFVLMCNMFALGMVYPSKFIKNLHLKYFSFSEKKKYEETGDDLAQLEMSLMSRILSSLTIFFLNWSRFLITFIHPQHRKKIEEAMRGVNMVIVEEKYFWKMYDSSGKNSTVVPNAGVDPIAQMSLSNINNKSVAQSRQQVEARQNLKQSKSPRSLPRDSVIKAKVGQFIQIPFSSNTGEKKYTFYRNIEMTYYPETCQLTVMSEEDSKSTTYTLQQLTEEPNLMLRLQFENEDQPIFVKFKAKKEYELFVNTIYLSSNHND